LRLTNGCNDGRLERRLEDEHHFGSAGINHLAMEFGGLCGLRRGSRVKSGIPLETRTNGVCGEEGCQDHGRLNDLGSAEVDGRKNTGREEGFLDS
jgi:hypothetical protein